jgi:uncharacterized membrane protein YfcA
MKEVIMITLFNVLASILSGCSGFGMSTMTTSILIHFYPITEVFLFTGLTHVVGSFWILLFMRNAINWKLLFYFGGPSIIGSFLGADFAVDLNRIFLTKGIGIFLIFYVVLVRWYGGYQFPANPFVAAIGGGLSGFLAGLFGFSGAMRALFLSSFGLSYSQYIFMNHMFELIIDATRAVSYIHRGVEMSPALYSAFLLSPFTLVFGAYIVRYLISKASSQLLEKWVTGILLLEGVRLFFVG